MESLKGAEQPSLIAEQLLKEKQIPQSKIIYGTFFVTRRQTFKTLERQLIVSLT